MSSLARARRVTGALGVALLFATGPSDGAQLRTWTGGASDLQRGDADGVAVTSSGRLFLAPRMNRLGQPASLGGFAHVWAGATDSAGNLFLGTGPDGKILKITPAGKQSVFFSVEEPMVTAVAVLPSGEILAGTAPEGKIYRIRPDGKGSVWSKTGERYVWSLVTAPDGTVYAGTGEQGIIFKIDASGNAEKFFDSDEPHIVSLRQLPHGGLLAGGAGRGLIYKIDSEGHGIVLYDDDLPEVKGLVVQPDESVIAAILAPPEPERRPPAVRIQVTGGAGGPTSDAAADLADRSSPAMEGVIEGLPSYGESSARGLRGRVVQLAPDGTTKELWRSSSEAPLSLALDAEGRALFGVGEPARLYRVEPDGEVSLLATLREAQVTGLVPTGKAIVVATSNPASTYLLERQPPETGSFVSRPLDAGGPTRWGTIRWRMEGAPGHVEVYTRTGNSADPDDTWSAWSPALTNADGSTIVNPEGRFLQWRARMLGGAPASLAGATVTFLSRNRAPSIRDLRFDGTTPFVSAKATFRWTGSDPDGDPIDVEVQSRRQGQTTWTTATRVEGGQAVSSGQDTVQTWKDGSGVWDVSGIEEGAYEIRARASDDAANYPGEGKQDLEPLSDIVIVDRTPPVIEARRSSGGKVDVTTTDVLSPVVRLEALAEGKVLFAVRPGDGVCDSRRETFTLNAEQVGSAGSRVLRATDAAGNTAELPIPGP